ncbi:unnamed protein product, partial [Laminaria digitata]
KKTQDWSVNKRRVKRLLRSMNNDAWKAAVNPSLGLSATSSTETATTTATTSAEATASAATTTTASETEPGGGDAPPPPPPAGGGNLHCVDGPLSESLKLEPDFELEPGVDLKADLGIAPAGKGTTATVPGVEHREAAGEGEGGGDSGVEIGTSGRSEDLGFEMIEKAEAVGAAVGAGGGGTPPEVARNAAPGGGKARKGWPWGWSRS